MNEKSNKNKAFSLCKMRKPRKSPKGAQNMCVNFGKNLDGTGKKK